MMKRLFLIYYHIASVAVYLPAFVEWREFEWPLQIAMWTLWLIGYMICLGVAIRYILPDEEPGRRKHEKR